MTYYPIPRALRSSLPVGLSVSLWVTRDQTMVRGNAIASGDDAFDKQYEDDILQRLDREFEDWAWACVQVVVTGAGLQAAAHLAGCSYRDAADFLDSDTFQTLVEEALAEWKTAAEQVSNLYVAISAEEALSHVD